METPAQPPWTAVLAAVASGLLLQLVAGLYAHSKAAFDPRALVINAFFNLGLVLLVAHRYDRRWQHRFASGGVSVLGKVVQRHQGGGSGNARKIEVEYTAAGGTTHRVLSTGAATSAPAVGETARVYYRPESPADGRLEFDWKLRGFVLALFAAIGLTIGVVGVVGELIRVALGL